MDVHPNPGPNGPNPRQPKLTKFFNTTKKVQLKFVLHQHHLKNYLFFRNNNIIPKGLLPKCRPTISTSSRYFYKQWQQNQYICGRNYLKLLTQECRRTIQALQKELVIKKELLRKNSNEESFNYYNDKLASMAHSLESVLFNSRLRKNHFTRRYNPTNPNHSTHNQSQIHSTNHPTPSSLQNHDNIRPRR